MSEMAFSADGDFMSDVVGIVDTTLWRDEDFANVDACARVDRYNLAVALTAIRRAELMQVAEFFVPRS